MPPPHEPRTLTKKLLLLFDHDVNFNFVPLAFADLLVLLGIWCGVLYCQIRSHPIRRCPSYGAFALRTRPVRLLSPNHPRAIVLAFAPTHPISREAPSKSAFLTRTDRARQSLLVLQFSTDKHDTAGKRTTERTHTISTPARALNRSVSIAGGTESLDRDDQTLG